MSTESTQNTDWNPYFVAYARSHGRDPEAQIAHDREQWPGGVMCGFISWIDARWAEWRRERGLPRDEVITERLRDDFGAWLEARTAAEVPA